jgi:hypothetical protein
MPRIALISFFKQLEITASPLASTDLHDELQLRFSLMINHKLVSCVINVCVVGAAFLLGGCQHSLAIKNLDTYRRQGVVSETPVSVGLIVHTNDEPSSRIGEGIAAGLRNSSTDVLYPYAPAGSRKVDVQADVTIQPSYKGSGANFFINFPGFLIFTPAWNGYVYKVDYDVAVSLKRAADHAQIGSFSLPIKLNVRHADYNRTWTEISWLEVGAIALGGGIAFIQYDDHVSPLVADAAKSTLGTYIAQEIVQKMNCSPSMLKAPATQTAAVSR